MVRQCLLETSSELQLAPFRSTEDDSPTPTVTLEHLSYLLWDNNIQQLRRLAFKYLAGDTCHKSWTPRISMKTELSLTVLSRASRECVYRCLLALHCPCLNTSDSCTSSFSAQIPSEGKKIQGLLCKVLYVPGRHTLESSPPLRPAAPALAPPHRKHRGKEEKHRSYLLFGVKAGELLTKPIKSTAYSVPENLPFHFLPDTTSPIRNGATRQRRRGKLQPIPNS